MSAFRPHLDSVSTLPRETYKSCFVKILMEKNYEVNKFVVIYTNGC